MTIMDYQKLLIELMDFEKQSYLQNRMKCRIIVKDILINTLINNFAFRNQYNAITTWQKLRGMSHFRRFIILSFQNLKNKKTFLYGEF